MKETTKRLSYIGKVPAQIKNIFQCIKCYSSELAIPLRVYVVMFLFTIGMLVVMCICNANAMSMQCQRNANEAGSVLTNILCSLLASIVYAFITDIAATRRMNKKMKMQYQSLLYPLIISIEGFYADMVAINSRLEPEQICKRNFVEWVDFFTEHYDDEETYDQAVVYDMQDLLTEIANEANSLWRISIMRFDHKMLGNSKRFCFSNLGSVANEVAEFLENDDVDSAMALVKGRFKDAVLRVYPTAPFDQKVDCNDEL